MWKLSPNQRDLWLTRLHYLVFMGGLGFVMPFANLFYFSLGLVGTQVGVISSISAITGLIAAPLWASRYKQSSTPRRYLQATLFFAAIGYLLISQQLEFLPILLAVAFQASAGSGILPISDTLAVTVAEKGGAGYGSVRLWGSLGWIFCLLLAGQLVKRFGFQVGYLGVAIAFLLGIGLLFLISPVQFHSHVDQSNQPKTGLLTAAQRVLKDRVLMGFAIALVFVGFLNNGVLQFENVYLSQLGADKDIISIAGIMGAVVELFFMWFTDRLMRQHGAHRLMMVSLSSYVILRLIVLLFPSVLMIMAIRFIGGVSFSLYTVSYVGLIRERTSTEERSTILALYTVTLANTVSIVAAPIAGAAFDALGSARWLYALSAAGYFISAFVMWLVRPRSQVDSAGQKSAV